MPKFIDNSMLNIWDWISWIRKSDGDEFNGPCSKRFPCWLGDWVLARGVPGVDIPEVEEPGLGGPR